MKWIWQWNAVAGRGSRMLKDKTEMMDLEAGCVSGRRVRVEVAW